MIMNILIIATGVTGFLFLAFAFIYVSLLRDARKYNGPTYKELLLKSNEDCKNEAIKRIKFSVFFIALSLTLTILKMLS